MTVDYLIRLLNTLIVILGLKVCIFDYANEIQCLNKKMECSSQRNNQYSCYANIMLSRSDIV